MIVTIRPLAASDVRHVADLHERAFPGFFLSALGTPFLRQFYSGFVGDPTTVTVVACDEQGKLIGAAVGTTQPSRFFQRLVQRRWFGFGLASARVATRHPSFVPRLLRAIRYRGDSPEAASGNALLSSICVDPSAKRTGVGRQLLEAWTAEVARLGSHGAYLTTDARDNDDVNRFYASQGWTVTETFATPEGRLMNVYTISIR